MNNARQFSVNVLRFSGRFCGHFSAHNLLHNRLVALFSRSGVWSLHNMRIRAGKMANFSPLPTLKKIQSCTEQEETKSLLKTRSEPEMDKTSGLIFNIFRINESCFYYFGKRSLWKSKWGPRKSWMFWKSGKCPEFRDAQKSSSS